MVTFVKSTSGSTSGFLAFFTNFGPKITQKRQKQEVVDFGTTRCGFSQKSPNLDFFSVIFGVFEQFLAKPHLTAKTGQSEHLGGACLGRTELLMFKVQEILSSILEKEIKGSRRAKIS